MAGVEELNGPSARPRVAPARAVLVGGPGGTSTMLSVVLRRALLVTVLCALAPLARADDPPIVVVERTTGQPLRGRLLDLTGRTFRLQLADGSVVEVPEREVREVRFEAPAAPPQHDHRPLHGAPTASIRTAPGRVSIVANPSTRDEYVLTSLELWRRTGDGPWTKLQALPPGEAFFADSPADPRAAYTYKVVSVGRVDEDSPVVQRYRLTLPEDQVRRESELLGPVTPGPGCYVVPVAVFADGAAMAQVHAWTRGPDQPGTWQAWTFRMSAGQPIGGTVGEYDLRTGATLEAARIEARVGAPARLVLRLRHADGRVEEVDDRQTLPDAIDRTTRPRGVVTAAPASPTPRDRGAEVRAALTSQRPLTLNFPLDTPLGDVLPLLRDLTGVDVVASPRIDADEARIQFSVRDVPQAELLALIFEMVAVEARPWCGVLWLQARGDGEPWVRPAAAGQAGALLERARVDLELSRFPLRDALDLLRAQTGLNVVISGAAQDLIDSDSLTATITARDLSLQDALTLIVDGTDQLHWHARGSVVQVLTRTERPTRELLLEQLLRDIATGDEGLLEAKLAIPSNNGAAKDQLVRDLLALGEAPGTLTVERLSRALKLEPAADGTWNVVGLAEPGPEPGAPSARLREAKDKAGAGDLAGAIAIMDRALAESPGDLDALLLRAELEISRRDRAGARRDAEQVLGARPEHPLALTILAYALPDGDHSGRIELCTRALRGDPTLVRALVLRADEQAQLRRLDEAQRDVREARRLAPEDDAVWAASARVAFALGRPDEAQTMAERAVALDDHDPRARYTLAKILEERGDLDGALRQLSIALEHARERDVEAVTAIQEDLDALRARQPARTPSQPTRPTRSAWVVTIDAAKHGEQALLRLAAQQALPRAQAFAIVDGDLWVDPAGPAIGVVVTIAAVTQPGPAIAALTEPDTTGTRTLTWTDRLQGAALVDGFRFLVRTSGGELFEGRVQRRGEGVLELMFSRP